VISASASVNAHSSRFKLDGRTRQARLIRAVADELTHHVGGAPNPVQRLLIARAARITGHLAALDAKAALTECDTRTYTAANGALLLTLRELEKPHAVLAHQSPETT
jgi:hypothetical protein